MIELKQVSLYLPTLISSSSRGSTKSETGGQIDHDRKHVTALDHINVRIEPGERVALIGHNGAGKTSLLRLIAGIFAPSAGVRTVDGSVMALISTSTGMSPNETGRDNARLIATLYDVPRARIPELIEEVIDFSELGDFIDLPVRTYSAGMRARLGFSIISSLAPENLVLDEVMGTGDASFQKKANNRMRAMAEKASTVLIATHSFASIRGLCSRAIWLHHGKVLEDGPIVPVWQSYVKKATNAEYHDEMSLREDA